MKILNEKTILMIVNNSNPDKCGYLLKKSSEYKRTFKRRYFVLIGNFLVYYDKKSSNITDSDPIGTVLLEGHFVEMINDQKQNYVFRISFGTAGEKPLKTYVLAAESEGDLKVINLNTNLLFIKFSII